MSRVPESGNQHTDSRDFVGKLFRILDNLELKHIVRWTESADSFVIHDTEQFARVVLQKYFKHGNFASFVRQLNKYDFHKVRQNLNERSPKCNPEACEYRHTDFQKDRRDLLDRIRRKPPAARNHRTNVNYDLMVQHVDMITCQMAGLHQKIEQTEGSYFDLATNLTRLLKPVLDMSNELQILKGNCDLPNNSMPEGVSIERSDHLLPQYYFPVDQTDEAANQLDAAIR